MVAELRDLIHGEGKEVGDRVAWHLDADGVDEDDAAKARGVEQGDLSGYPAADRVADDGDVAQAALFEQRGVERGEPGDAVQGVGTGSVAEAG